MRENFDNWNKIFPLESEKHSFSMIHILVKTLVSSK